MKTSAFLATLRAHPALPVVFRHGGDTVPAGCHLTEVKRVAYETMDCGALTHRWSETQFELWTPPLNSLNPLRGPMPARKILAILDRVEKELPLVGDTDARVHTSLGSGVTALWDIASVAPTGGQLVVALTPDRTRCKAAERQVGRLTGGCCRSEPGLGDKAASGAACGCSGSEQTTGKREAAACCA
ncbi:MAG: hypothetical protein HYX71_05035 [Opitutae bacterium]|nr:hypothetical protein [Opitutae bacterium]